MAETEMISTGGEQLEIGSPLQVIKNKSLNANNGNVPPIAEAADPSNANIQLNNGSATNKEAGATADENQNQQRQQNQTSKEGQDSSKMASQRSSKNAIGKSKFVPRGPSTNTRVQHLDNTSAQMYRTNPQKLDAVMGIGPGGSDLSQFFQQKTNVMTSQGSSKPQTAGTLGGTLLIEAGEFGIKSQNSKNSSAMPGPTITNIGFSGASQNSPKMAYPQSSGMVNLAANQGSFARNQQLPPSRTGSFKMSSNERSRSFLNQKQKLQQRQQSLNQQHTYTGEYAQNSLQLRAGLNQMKPFIQGSSLHKGNNQVKNSRTNFTASQPAVKRASQFSDYSFFSQKLNQNNIPKNQIIKYRKEMQQLKFYQTLNNYPNIVHQQQEKEKQMAQAAKITQQKKALSYTLKQSMGQKGDEDPGVTLQQEASLITESKERGSTKQTVYQMHSSRQKLLESDNTYARKSIHDNTRVSTKVNNMNEGSNADLQKSSIQAADIVQPYSNMQNAARYDGKNSSVDSTIDRQREVHNGTGQMAQGQQTTEYSTHVPTIEHHRAMFDLTPHQKQNTVDKHQSLQQSNELSKPMITQTKKVVKTPTSNFGMVNDFGQNVSQKMVNSGTSTSGLNPNKSATFQTLKAGATQKADDGISSQIATETKSGQGVKSKGPASQQQVVDRIEIKQQEEDQSYNTQSYSKAGRPVSQQPSTSSIPPATRPKVYLHTQTASQEQLIQQRSPGGVPQLNSGLLMIQGNQVKKDETVSKEYGRTQSMKPKAKQPLMKNEKDDSKTLYLGASGKVINEVKSPPTDQTQALNLKDVQKSGVNNADLSAGTAAIGGNSYPDTVQGTGPPGTGYKFNDEMPYSQKALEQTHQKTGVTTSGKGKSGFEEQVSGVGVSGLFSVWGPSSQQTKHRKRIAKPTTGIGFAYSNDEPGTIYGKRPANTADVNKRTGQANQIGLGLDGVEPGNMAHHMQLVNSIINDGSLHNLVFSNGSLTSAEMLQQNRSQVAKLIQGGTFGGKNADQEGDYDDEDETEDDEDEQIIVTMLRSMNSKKLETCQLKDMKMEVDVEKIRSEVKLEFFKQIQLKRDIAIESEWRNRMVKFDRLFNKIIAKKLQQDQEKALMIKLEEQAKIYEERQANPYYMALKALKDERDRFIDFYQSGLMLGFQINTEHDAEDNQALPSASLGDAVESYYGNEGGDADLFKHTRVDIGEDLDSKKSARDGQPVNDNTQREKVTNISMVQQDDSIVRQRDDIFCFYNLQVSLPKTFFERLGDSKVIRSEAINAISNYIKHLWPSLAQKKRVTYRVGFNAQQYCFNTVALGKDAPLSRCCMTHINFMITKEYASGGTVLCTNPLCAKNELDKFDLTQDLIVSTFEMGLKHQDLPMLRAGSAHFMEQRKKMQDGGESSSSSNQLAMRYKRVASNEISKKIGAGKYKHCRLQNVITSTKQQQDRGAGSPYHGKPLNTSDDLVDLIMGVSRRNTEFSRSNASQNEIQNENQMLAELIQKHSMAKQKHRASLPINKLMRNLNQQKNHVQQQNSHFQQQVPGMPGHTTRLEDGTYNVQFFDSMFQHSHQFGNSIDLRSGTDQKMAEVREKIYTQDHQHVQQNSMDFVNHGSRGQNADIPEATAAYPASNQYVLTKDGNFDKKEVEKLGRPKPLLLNHQVFQETSKMGQQEGKDGGKTGGMTANKSSNLMTSNGDDASNTNVNTMTAENYPDAKYSQHSKSPMMPAGLTKGTQNSMPNTERNQVDVNPVQKNDDPEYKGSVH